MSDLGGSIHGGYPGVVPPFPGGFSSGAQPASPNGPNYSGIRGLAASMLEGLRSKHPTVPGSVSPPPPGSTPAASLPQALADYFEGARQQHGGDKALIGLLDAQQQRVSAFQIELPGLREKEAGKVNELTGRTSPEHAKSILVEEFKSVGVDFNKLPESEQQSQIKEKSEMLGAELSLHLKRLQGLMGWQDSLKVQFEGQLKQALENPDDIKKIKKLVVNTIPGDAYSVTIGENLHSEKKGIEGWLESLSGAKDLIQEGLQAAVAMTGAMCGAAYQQGVAKIQLDTVVATVKAAQASLQKVLDIGIK